MALRIKSQIVEALKAARAGDDVDLSKIVVPRMSGRVVLRAEGEEEAPADDDAGSLVRSFYLSDKNVDRDRDTIDPKGWDLKQFQKNGTVLWAHDNRQPPVAAPMNTKVDGEALLSDAKFTDAYDFSKLLLDLIDAKILKNVSVGFIPEEWVVNEERQGLDFTKQKLVEFSIVPVGSHPDAMVQLAHEKSLSLTPILEWGTKWLDGDESVADAVADDAEMAVMVKSLGAWKAKSESGLLVPAQVEAAQALVSDTSPAKDASTEPKPEAAPAPQPIDEDKTPETPTQEEPADEPLDPVVRVLGLLDDIESALVECDLADETRKSFGTVIDELRAAINPSPEVVAEEEVRSMIREAVSDLFQPKEQRPVEPQEVVTLVREALSELKSEILREAGRLPA